MNPERLRRLDMFAMFALQGLLSESRHPLTGYVPIDVARRSYDLALEMDKASYVAGIAVVRESRERNPLVSALEEIKEIARGMAYEGSPHEPGGEVHRIFRIAEDGLEEFENGHYEWLMKFDERDEFCPFSEDPLGGDEVTP